MAVLLQPLYYYGRLADVIIGLAFVQFIALVCLPWCAVSLNRRSLQSEKDIASDCFFENNCQ